MFRLLVLLFLLLSCSPEDVSEYNIGETPKFEGLFPESPFLQKIKDNPQIHPDSDKMVNSLVSESQKSFVLSVKEWTVPVFYSTSVDQTFDIPLKAGWAPVEEIKGVNIPAFAKPDPASDGHLSIIDKEKGCVYDFWKAQKTKSGWKAAWANALPIESDGVYSSGLSARGSGFALLQGLIWPEEVKNNEIKHALIFSYNHTKSGGPVWPATESDGTTNGLEAIPEGALIQLSPDLDLDSLNLNNYEKTIAKALQEYGMYCTDDGGGLQLYTVNANSYAENPYGEFWGEQSLVSLKKIPAKYFRVLQFGLQKNTTATISPNRCNQF
ncbi:hypothetical protein [Jiulongibacter sediminis]|jgi:hypothetical protein|uniref:hypothetical protein n=1 Tax=Jiulongibacter sediminis TaxID=1605367 RepID=UPI0026F00E70|nr:hypothetical protein [Jiulongibacter sediminis]